MLSVKPCGFITYSAVFGDAWSVPPDTTCLRCSPQSPVCSSTSTMTPVAWRLLCHCSLSSLSWLGGAGGAHHQAAWVKGRIWTLVLHERKCRTSPGRLWLWFLGQDDPHDPTVSISPAVSNTHTHTHTRRCVCAGRWPWSAAAAAAAGWGGKVCGCMGAMRCFAKLDY